MAIEGGGDAGSGLNGSLGRKLRMGIVGGGIGSFIGRVHVTAAVLDNRAELVAGAFSSDAAKSKASDCARAYREPSTMANRLRTPARYLSSCRCCTATPLGVPVEPEV